jgi:hypothetical protein
MNKHFLVLVVACIKKKQPFIEIVLKIHLVAEFAETFFKTVFKTDVAIIYNPKISHEPLQKLAFLPVLVISINLIGVSFKTLP